MFYVYEVRIKATGEVIYVGKGTRNRYRVKKKNTLLNKLIEENECEFERIAQYNTEEEAFEAERQRIVELKEIGQAVCNKITSSTGGAVNWWTEERRQYMSDHNPMKCADQRQRMSDNNPMKNQDVAKRVGKKHRLRFTIGNKEYEGLKEAAEEYGVTIQAISYWFDNGKTRDGIECHRIKENKTIAVPFESIVNNHTIIYNGKEYDTPKEVAAIVGCTPATILRWLKRGYSPTGEVCRYKDDDTEYQYVDLKSANSGVKRAVEVNGTRYSSIIEASRETGYKAKDLNYYLRHAKCPPIQCRYVD